MLVVIMGLLLPAEEIPVEIEGLYRNLKKVFSSIWDQAGNRARVEEDMQERCRRLDLKPGQQLQDEPHMWAEICASRK